ncbi:APC family permease [Pseudomonas guariconensis]|uniref:Amino acid permease n=1 Tax=Pseudomonas guariconensis TaxID=1288410 RepID=A0AAX0VU50_9PSED|nr:APC family permease [Pseudomonas guariconensis]PLV17814.1 amino acid permease [Pseudomonas guariconensis]PLV22598.1 amino acid permease [Pseudomonas guariconensis]PLV27621.1 amino acid permease [Pseudomonas guariconensis]
MSELTPNASLKRTLGPISVLLFGLAFIAPLIVFGTYGVISQASQNTTALSYVVASIGVIFTALSYGRLVKVFPAAGSAYTYTRKILNPNLGFMVGWAALLDYFFIPMLIWLLGASYFNMAFSDVPQWVWISGFIVTTTLLNILGIQVANRFNIVLMVIQLTIIAIFIGLCWHYISAANGPGGLLSAEPFFNQDVPFAATMAGAAIAAYSFLGFDALSTLSEETKDPSRTIPRAILLVAVIGGVLYVGSSYFMYLAHPSIEFANVDGAAFEIARMIGGDLFFAVVLTGIIIAHFAAGLSFQASVGRLLYALGRDNQLPRKLFGALHPRYQTPAFNILLSGAFGVVGFGLTIATATSLVNFGAFVAFTSVNFCALKLTFDANLKDGVGVFRGVLFPIIGAITAGWMLISLDKDALMLGCGWLVLGAFYLGFRTNFFRTPVPEAHV